WKVEQTQNGINNDGVGSVVIKIDLNNQGYLETNGGPNEYALILDEDGDFSAGSTLITNPTPNATFSINAGVLTILGSAINFNTYDNANTDDDTIYFAVAGPIPPAPGGVVPGLQAWFKADKDVFNDAGITPIGDGEAVQQWNDSSI